MPVTNPSRKRSYRPHCRETHHSGSRAEWRKTKTMNGKTGLPFPLKPSYNAHRMHSGHEMRGRGGLRKEPRGPTRPGSSPPKGDRLTRQTHPRGPDGSAEDGSHPTTGSSTGRGNSVSIDGCQTLGRRSGCTGPRPFRQTLPDTESPKRHPAEGSRSEAASLQRLQPQARGAQLLCLLRNPEGPALAHPALPNYSGLHTAPPPRPPLPAV